MGTSTAERPRILFPGGRHGHKLIAHLTALDAAVIHPGILYSRLEKWLQEVVADNGMFLPA